MELARKQVAVGRGMAAGAALTLLALGLAVVAPPAMLLPPPEPGAALRQALAWDALVACCLAAAVARLAHHRFVTAEDIDGGGLTPGTPRARLLQAQLQNTLEQTVLALAVHAAWAASLPAAAQAAVPAAVVLFVAGRLLFWRGYDGGAPARALGFALTFCPSLVLLAGVLVHAAWRVAS